PLLRYGLEALARDAADIGADGVLVTDLPPEEAGAWIAVARGAGIDTVFLAAPTSPDERLRRVAEASRGFVYAVSRTGGTGERDAISSEAAPLVRRIKALTEEPVVLGFGLSTPAQVRAAAEVADGVVVGSALVRYLEEHPHGDVAGQVRWLKSEMGANRRAPRPPPPPVRGFRRAGSPPAPQRPVLPPPALMKAEPARGR